MHSLEGNLRVASYQGPIIEKKPEVNLAKILQVMEKAHNNMVDILCMPESYLHGYFKNINDAKRYSINLHSKEFSEFCNRFKQFSPTLIVGLNEIDEEKIFNTAVVIEDGKCIGKYRKAYTYAPYDYFSVGSKFPIFEKKGIKYGIIICIDSLYREPALITALKGARILFCPMFNRANKSNDLVHHKSHFITRAFDNNCWLISSDIIWGNENDTEICSGQATIIDNNGQIVCRSQPFEEMILTYDIPLKKLEYLKIRRIMGNPELFEIMIQEYKKRI